MMIVILHNAQNNQAQIMWENGDPELAKNVLRQMADVIEQQQAEQAQAQGNGQQRRPSGLIIPPTVVPRDVVDPPKP